MGSMTGLGRLYIPDERDAKYPLKARRATGIDRRMWWSPTVLDQGNTSECVGHSTRTYLSAGPCVNRAGPDQHELYREAQKVDEWPGEDYEGTSVRAAFKVLKNLGLVSEYRWAMTMDDIINHVLGVGPVVMGTLWDDELSNPDRYGYIAPGSGIERVQEGHAWAIVGGDRRKGARMQQSWGRGWGENGRAWIRWEHVEQLLSLDGEAAVAIEVKL